MILRKGEGGGEGESAGGVSSWFKMHILYKNTVVLSRSSRIVTPMPSSIRNSLLWIFDAFERDSTFITKRMFGLDAAYIDGLLCLVAGDRDRPWNGLLVCSSQDRHAALMQELPALQPHPVLGKWLYVAQDDPAFETTVDEVTALVLARDPRIGVEPKPRKSRGKKSTLPKA
ncbi:hypothetical protein P3T20_002979 [Paraburkholderia sp. GAS206C]|jgi:hypothetical protein|uniref:Uncharacterized protein n=2 Tax=Burkholderiaceae TaxID=119060 RepID=A0A1N6G1Z1_9BURK|nr:hypothetical protein SAMN05444168_2042 [Paraburkholderia phenazinium]